MTTMFPGPSRDVLTPPPDARRYSEPRCELWIWQAVPGVVVQKCVGHAPAAIGRAMVQRLSAIATAGERFVIFDEWQGVTGYDTETRTIVTDWTRANVHLLDGIHILVGSKLVAMGISVSNLVTGGIATSYSDPIRFKRALTDEIERRARGTARLGSR